MGFGKFLKKAITAPLKATKSVVKSSVKSTGKILKGDVKGAFKEGVKSLKNVAGEAGDVVGIKKKKKPLVGNDLKATKGRKASDAPFNMS